MPMRRWLPLALAVTALLVVAGIASHGRPLSRTHGGGPTPVFFDYVFTTIVLAIVIMIATAAWALLRTRTSGFAPPQGRFGVISGMLMMFAAAGMAVLFLHSGLAKKIRELEQRAQARGKQGQGLNTHAGDKNPAAHQARLRWDEIALIAVLIGGALGVAVLARRGRTLPRSFQLRRREAVAMTLDDSLDDLNAEPDLRKAIIAAYARMERALAIAGIPRKPAEAPFEYVERALTSLDASAESARRLTGLFEWAKFSQHEPDAQMRTEAVEALEAVRDELRAPKEIAA